MVIEKSPLFVHLSEIAGDMRFRIERFAREHFTDELMRKIEKDHEVPTGLVEKLGESHFMAAHLPEEYGGSGSCFVGATVQESLAYYNPNIALINEVSTGLFGNTLVEGGSEEQKTKILEQLAKGKETAAFALTEPGAGSNPRNMTSRVVDKGDYFELSGNKQFITNGKKADWVVWFARSPGDERISAYLVKRDGYEGHPSYEITVEENIGVRGSGTSTLIADKVWLPKTALLDAPFGDGTYEHHGLRLAFGALTKGRINIAADALGMMKRAIEESIEHAKNRDWKKGKKLIDSQVIQHYIADMTREYETNRAFVYKVAWEADTRGELNIRDASIAKLSASEALGRVINTAVQIYGGMGYTADTTVGQLFLHHRVWPIFEGPSEVQKDVIVREMLKD